MILTDFSHNSNFSLSEATATAAHGDGSATEFPPDWIPTEAPPMADDWQPVDPSRNLDVKGQFFGGGLPKNCCEAGALDRHATNMLVYARPNPVRRACPAASALQFGRASEPPVKGLSIVHISPLQCKRLRIVQSEAVQNV